MTDMLRKSVTLGDQQDYRTGGMFLPQLWTGGYPGLVAMPSRLIGISKPNDQVLLSTPDFEDMWAAAISKTITKQAALGWKVTDEQKSTQRVKRAQELYLGVEGGQGWVPFISKHLQDFLLTDNGAFIELIRASNARGARLLGMMHLSSLRCTRTGDPDWPVLYTDRQGREHALRDYQVLTFSDMPSSQENYFGAGRCAARRSYRTIYKLAGIDTYGSEKITGSRALAIHIVNGITQQAIEDAAGDAKEQQANRNHVVFMGSIIMTTLIKDQPASVATIPLAEIPDGFDAEKERDNGYNIYANNIGVPVQEIKPLSGQGLGTGTQTVVLDEAAQGQGIAAWRKQFEHAQNQHVLPAATTFYFSTNDVRDQKAAAEVAKLRADTRAVQVASGEITNGESRQLAAQADDIPEEWLDQDATPENQLTDSEKPTEALEPGELPVVQPAPAQQQTPPALRTAVQQAIQRTKAVREKAGPEELAALLEDATLSIRGATMMLQESGTLSDWQKHMRRYLTNAHTKAYQLGAGVETLDEQSRGIVEATVKEQEKYLKSFAGEIAEASGQWNPRWNSRAEMYAKSAKASYWRGATAGYSLPAWPGDGTTQCLTECNCRWDIQELDGEGNIDAYWRMGAAERHCQTCPERAADWSPYRIRNGEVVE